MYTLKVNQRAQEEKERKEKERLEREFEEKIQALVGRGGKPRKSKGLQFHEPGRFQALAEKERKEAKLKALREKISQLSAKSGINDAVKLATLTLSKDDKKPLGSDNTEQDDIPNIEWWDQALLSSIYKDTPDEIVINEKNLDMEIVAKIKSDNSPCEDMPGHMLVQKRYLDIYMIAKINLEEPNLQGDKYGISKQIQYPAVKRPPGGDKNDVQIPLYLTKDELKKQRKQRRREEQEKKQYEIKIGMRPKPEPKLKKSNILYTLGEDIITKPSEAEIKVREQVEQRQLAHKEHNESKKLTNLERKEKKAKKYQEDLSVTGVWVCIYRIFNMTSQLNKNKVWNNARQLHMSGILAMNKDINIVLVEGGPKQQAKYKHVLLDRIDWNIQPSNKSHSNEVPMEVNEDKPKTTNKCVLVWEGQVEKRSFYGFKIKQFEQLSDAKKHFQSLNLNHFWDLAFNMSILETIQDDHFNI